MIVIDTDTENQISYLINSLWLHNKDREIIEITDIITEVSDLTETLREDTVLTDIQ